ncbi:hypothetical protein [Amycolatopsis lexingtonensis]|uniref:hypothetical protein n=1 Tax=Amycolatopsis lexingtonensis TaxID=218822 RepID=UPI003F6F0266
MTAEFPAAPVPPPRSQLAHPVFAGLIGVIVGAVLVGVPWLALTLLGGPSGHALTAPSSLGGLGRTQDTLAKFDVEKSKVQVARVDKADRETAARTSAAYGGAGAVVQQYQDDRLERSFQLIAVRAGSPELVAPYENAEELGLAAPSTELVRVGAVQCLVHNDAAPAGSTPDPDRSFVTNCQRSGPDLTVALRSISAEGNRDPRELAGIVEEAWKELS